MKEDDNSNINIITCHYFLIFILLNFFIFLPLNSQRAFRASPRKPKDDTVFKSEKSHSFDVWCFNAIFA